MNKTEAALFLGVSPRTLDNYQAKGWLSPTFEPSTRSRPVAQYAETDLQQLKERLEEMKAPVSAISSASATRVSANSVSATDIAETEGNSVSAIVPFQSFSVAPTGVSATLFTLDAETLERLVEEVASRRIEQSRAGEGVPLESKPLLVFSEAALFSGIAEKTLRDAAKRGELRSCKIGRSVRLRPADLLKWIDQQFSRDTAQG